VAPRASWKGYLKLSLVTCAVALYPAQTSTERISFNQLIRATGNRLKQQMIDPETGEVVEREARARGYEVSRGEYLLIEDAEECMASIAACAGSFRGSLPKFRSKTGDISSEHRLCSLRGLKELTTNHVLTKSPQAQCCWG
jgi:hypothetical protein